MCESELQDTSDERNSIVIIEMRREPTLTNARTRNGGSRPARIDHVEEEKKKRKRHSRQGGVKVNT